MNTPSHLIISAALHKKVNRTDIPGSAFLLGSIMPDFPLAFLTLGTYFYHALILKQNTIGLMENIIHPAYFNNPVWITAHNLLHSPVALFIYLAFLWKYRSQPGSRGNWWLWFVLSGMLHTSIDILTHVTDGPLLFWPLNWTIRFHSLISYWDPAYFGLQFAVFELLLDSALLGYLFLPKLVAWFKKRAATSK